jgi:cell division protein FtsW (lipid II flippase)
MGLIELAVLIFVFACVVGGIFWVMDRVNARAPIPAIVYYLVGAIIVIILLVFLVQVSGVAGDNPIRFRMSHL